MGRPRPQNNKMNRAAFLDRDGVVNRAIIREGRAVAPRSLEDFHFMPGIHVLTEKLRQAQYKIIVVTNQPDVFYGYVDRATVDEMHRIVRHELQIDDIRVCFHIDAHNCDCRKPKPGLLLSAAKDFDLDLRQSFIIGDTGRDMDAGKAVNCRTILLDGGYAQEHLENADDVIHSLYEVGDLILNVRT